MIKRSNLEAFKALTNKANQQKLEKVTAGIVGGNTHTPGDPGDPPPPDGGY